MASMSLSLKNLMVPPSTLTLYSMNFSAAGASKLYHSPWSHF